MYFIFCSNAYKSFKDLNPPSKEHLKRDFVVAAYCKLGGTEEYYRAIILRALEDNVYEVRFIL